jgi:hypothetical protein
MSDTQDEMIQPLVREPVKKVWQVPEVVEFNIGLTENGNVNSNADGNLLSS